MVEDKDQEFGHDEELQDLKQIVDEQDAEERQAEDKRMAGHAEAIEADRLVDAAERHESFENQRRMIDEVTDRKEEDGGEHR